jgi:glucose-6-phosphate 1-dehydrogenase
MFYFALPPTVFAAAGKALKEGGAFSPNGWNKFVLEKPFGKDLESSNTLSR